MKEKLLSLVLSLICMGLIALPAINSESFIQPLSFFDEAHTN